jgi:hypothetical protein
VKKALAMDKRRKFNTFDVFVLAGAAVNVAVVLLLLGYWILH